MPARVEQPAARPRRFRRCVRSSRSRVLSLAVALPLRADDAVRLQWGNVADAGEEIDC